LLSIEKAQTDEQIKSCFKVMVQLRPQLLENEFINIVRQQFAKGYHLAFILNNEVITAVAGYRYGESLAWGKYLYVDDLVTDETHRSTGQGKVLLDWLREEARKNHCSQLHLDSGVQRKDAHRFYEREGMTFSSHHYAIKI
jgi:GNAT superfamily N-acetyltransferase